MEKRLKFAITPQPSDTTCGPACLYGVYRYWGCDTSIDDIIREVEMLPDGGTIAVSLALHAIQHGFDATIYTSNLHLFDPSWFEKGSKGIASGLQQQMEAKQDTKLRAVSQAYLKYIEAGGKIFMEDISFDLISSIIRKGIPLIAGLNCTWLYRCKRELPNLQPDDVRGESSGHFVVVYGTNNENREFLVADPFGDHPFSDDHCYSLGAARLIGAIMLGVVTYDAKLLLLTPRGHNFTS